jgi:chorismate lyase/3-hydroxybenzoate synthase
MPANTQLTNDPPILTETSRPAVSPPPWVSDLISSPNFALTTASIDSASEMDAQTLERRVAQTYASIMQSIDGLSTHRPVRLWNYIPAIHAPMEPQRDRYMVFNAGRYLAYAQRYGGPSAFDRNVPTASGIGHDHPDLIIHCLSTSGHAIAIDNPRQVPPHRYSARFGPLPPCFARATLLPEPGLILVGGTASIKGEDSLHTASLSMQFHETLTNLASVVEAAHAKAGVAKARPQSHWLNCFTDLRVYYARAADIEPLTALMVDAFSERCRIEMRRADLCRAELLVEIEGVAKLQA